MGAMLLVLAGSFYFLGANPSTTLKVALIGATVVYLFFYAISMGPTAWTLCSEIFPLEGRDFGFASAAASNWILNALAVNFSLIIMSKFGGSILFIGFAAVCIIGIFFVYMFVPETTNVSLEKIELNLKNGVRLRDLGKE